MQDFFKEYKWWLVTGFVLPFAVLSVWFSCAGLNPICDADGGNWLSFWGGFFAFYGTFFLGLVAIWQNKQANEQSKRLLDIESSRHSCNVILESSDSDSKCIRLSNENDGYENTRDIRLCIVNHGDAILKKIQISFPNGQIFFSHIILAKGESKNVIIRIPKDLNVQKRTEISFVSCNDVITCGNFDILLVGNDSATMQHYHFYGLQKKRQDNE